MTLAAALIFTGDASAATLRLLPSARTFTIGQEFTVDLLLDTDNASINTTEAAVNFPNGIVEFVSASRTGSIFSFWLEEPTISSQKDSVSFIGGTPRGVAGDALKILSLTFKTTGVGAADISLSNASVSAADGKGSNVLSKIVGTNVMVRSAVAMPEPLSASATDASVESEIQSESKIISPRDDGPESQPVERPQPVVRSPAFVGRLPEKPALHVPLYPDESRWYNRIGEAIVLWDLTPDVSHVAVKLALSPEDNRGATEAELFTGKSFGMLKEGIWFVTVHARNNVGWSEASQRRIHLDTTPPLPFNIEIDTVASDNPVRTIKFETQDSLSGVSRASIAVDGDDPIVLPVANAADMTIRLPLQPAGEHTVVARVFDAAGNSVEDDLAFEVLPLPMPSFSFFMPVVSQEEFIFASGKSIPGGLVTVRVRDANDQQVAVEEAVSDAAGDWSVSIKPPLATGKYELFAQATDERGAMSFLSAGHQFTMKPKTIMAIGFVDLGWFEIIMIIALALVAIASMVTAQFMLRRKKREVYAIIAGRDINKLCALLETEFKGLRHYQEMIGGDDTREKTEMGAHLQKIEDLVAKMKKYLGNEVAKLKE